MRVLFFLFSLCVSFAALTTSAPAQAKDAKEKIDRDPASSCALGQSTYRDSQDIVRACNPRPGTRKAPAKKPTTRKPPSKPTAARVSTKPLSPECLAALKPYTDSGKTKGMIQKLMAIYGRRTYQSKGLGKCWTAVYHQGLRPSGLVTKQNRAYFARDSGRDLINNGFVNVLTLPACAGQIRCTEDAPAGLIAVYNHSGGGHIEVKTGDGPNGGVVSDHYNPKPVTGFGTPGRDSQGRCAGRGFTLTGLYFKPNP